MPIPLHCEPRPVSSSSLAVGLNDRRTAQGTNTHELFVRNTVTKLVIYPVTLCVMFTPAKLQAVTFVVGGRDANLHSITTIERLGLLLIRGVRP